MIEKYAVVYDSLDLPETAKKLLSGEIKPPSLVYKSPFECFGFPPALMPFWSDGSSPAYLGFWKHWFNERKISIVNFYVEEGRAYETARNLEQFPWTELLRIADTANLAENSRVFAKEFNIDDLSVLDEITSETGDLPEGLLELEPFEKDAPLECFPDPADYKGDFPNDAMTLTKENLRNICSLEVGDELKQEISASADAPEWFTTENQEELFYRLLADKDLNGAWMSLNSTGWRYNAAKVAIGELEKEAKNPIFSQLVEAWIAEPHEAAGGY